MRTLIFVLFLSYSFVDLTLAQSRRFEFVGSIALPDVEVDGKKARIHSQGLFVTDKHFLITGRLERKPKRALLLRFPRRDLERAEYLDITPDQTDGEMLDHPGGFDVDAKGLYQIPLSTSHPGGPTLVKGYRIDPSRPLDQAKVESTVKIDDHLGAICCQGSTLIGANWDTKLIYFIRDGAVIRKIDQATTLSHGKPHVAVQDWKALTLEQKGDPRRVILGGLVKDESPRAIVQIADLVDGRVYETQRLGMREDVSKPITNEGLAVHEDMLYLLPEDIGHGAKVLQYRIKTRE